MGMRLILAAFLASVTSTAALAQPATSGAAATPAKPGPASVIPITVFAKRPFMQTPRISPDGTKIVVQMSHNKNGYLGIIDLANPGAAPDFFIATTEYRDVGDRTVNSWRWVGNDNVVVSMSSRKAASTAAMSSSSRAGLLYGRMRFIRSCGR